MLTPEFGRSGRTGETGGPNRSDRCGQSTQKTIWTSPLDSSRQVDQDTYVERLIQSSDERDMASGRSARHAVRLDRVRAVRPRVLRG